MTLAECAAAQENGKKNAVFRNPNHLLRVDSSWKSKALEKRFANKSNGKLCGFLWSASVKGGMIGE